MTELIKKIEKDVLSLPPQQRAFLADRLLSSLVENTLTDVDIAWLDEVQSRYEKYIQGLQPGLSADEVFREAKSIVEK